MRQFFIASAVVALGVSLSGCGAIYPPWKVYVAENEGKAALAEAMSSKQVAVQTAKAKMESAQYEATAEATRAQGAANAIKITGAALQANPEYLRYLYVNNLATSKDQIIYVPTEAALPILEAGRRVEKPASPR